jgi:hypothetical protein
MKQSKEQIKQKEKEWYTLTPEQRAEYNGFEGYLKADKGIKERIDLFLNRRER